MDLPQFKFGQEEFRLAFLRKTPSRYNSIHKKASRFFLCYGSNLWFFADFAIG